MGIIADKINHLKSIMTPPVLKVPILETKTHLIHGKLRDAGILTDMMERIQLDNNYWCCSRNDFLDIVAWDWTDKKQYVLEEYDCDNFAISFKARMDRRFHLNNVGVVVDFSGGHVYNVVVFSDGSLELFEPQGDRFVTNEKGTGYYACSIGSILI